MSELTDTVRFTIYPHEVAADKRASLPNIGAYMLDAAGEAAERRGFGIDLMHANGRAWVVSRMSIEMYEYPCECSRIDITTWIHATGHVASERQFEIRNSAGVVIGKASTLWSIIDFNTRKLVDLIDTTDLSDYVDTTDRNIAAPQRVNTHTADTDNISTHRVVYSDIDMNRHVSSMKYLQWALDALPFDYISTHRVVKCDINFVNEVQAGQTVTIRHSQSDAEHFFDIQNTDGRTCCKIRLVTDY